MTNAHDPGDITGTYEGSDPIGIVGLGLMGSAMARRLASHGCSLLGTDLCPDALQAFSDIGQSTRPASVRQIFSSCPRVILSLPTHRQVEEVLNTASESLREGQIVVDTTTGAPEMAEATAQRLLQQGVDYLDATVSGSSQQLADGQVTWMIGGRQEAASRCAELFDILGSARFHVGPSGSGGRMKLVTNLILGLNRAALAEGLVFAESMNLNLERTLEVLIASPAYSRIMDTKGQKMIRREFSPQARLSQHLKDVQLMHDQAASSGQPLPLSGQHQRLLEQAVDQGLGQLDNSALIEVLRRDQTAE